VIPRPLPIKFNDDVYTCCASHSSKPFVATGDYYGCIELMKMGDANCEKLLLKSKFVTITKVLFHQNLPLVFAIDSKGNSKMWQIGSITREFWYQVVKLLCIPISQLLSFRIMRTLLSIF